MTHNFEPNFLYFTKWKHKDPYLGRHNGHFSHLPTKHWSEHFKVCQKKETYNRLNHLSHTCTLYTCGLWFSGTLILLRSSAPVVKFVLQDANPAYKQCAGSRLNCRFEEICGHLSCLEACAGIWLNCRFVKFSQSLILLKSSALIVKFVLPGR